MTKTRIEQDYDEGFFFVKIPEWLLEEIEADEGDLLQLDGDETTIYLTRK